VQVAQGVAGERELRRAAVCRSRTALLASVNFAALPVVRLSTLSLSLANERSRMMRPIGW
jgi:hypothetical protein